MSKLNTQGEAEKQAVVIGSLLYPSWNNEACSTCQKNHKAGRVVEICPVIYNGKCFVEQVNTLIRDGRKWNPYPSLVFDLIRKEFPELQVINNYGTTEAYIREFKRTFYFVKNYYDNYEVRL